MNSKQASVVINGKKYACPAGTNLGGLLSTNGYGNMPCGGHAKCGKCRVNVKGDISPVTEEEYRFLTQSALQEGIRLACRTLVLGDCVVNIDKSGTEQICTDGEMPDLILDPAFEFYGAAVDIGTTTVAARLYDRDGRLVSECSRPNPQSVWGADVITRMEAALAGNAERIAKAIRSAIDEMLSELAAGADISAGKIDGMVITGNTVMLHFLTASDVEPLTHAPFTARRLFGETVTARELALSAIRPETSVYIPPCMAAFVGADTVTALLASDMRKAASTNVLIDIGTNGEMLLWHKEKLYACSTAAGPAFEGAGISMGMSGRSGAVDRVWTEPSRDGVKIIKAHVIGEASPCGICGSGLVDAVACLLETDMLDETGYLEDEPAQIASPVVLTQEDIRMVQLAKSAINAGMRTLLHTAGVTLHDVDTLYIAGGFGSYLNAHNAGRIGLLPEELVPFVRVIGNAALTGAAMLLLSGNLRFACERLSRETKIVELASNPVFAAEYMERMLF